jgi:seryl-tRNA synthetase
VVERVIELGREAGEAVAAAEHLRREAKENKATRIEAEQRASRLFERVKELETKLEMAEANLRTVLAAARGRGATAVPTDNEMEAVLRILKAPSETAADGGVIIQHEPQEVAGE